MSALASATVVTLRPAVAEDRDAILQWRNEPATREASFDTSAIAPEAHAAWFRATLGRPDRKLYVVLADGRACGVVRLDVSGEQATVNIFLAAAQHGRGIGPRALDAAAEVAVREHRLSTLVAEIKLDNAASLAAFARTGFVEVARRDGVVTMNRALGARRE